MRNFELEYKSALGTATTMYACAKEKNDKEMVQSLELIFPELRKSKDELTREELIHFLETCRDPRFVGNRKQDEWISWLEKQSKQEQLYIRFGEIPTDEKSKIYRGEEEIGTENGVSVYPAFKTDEGDIVLGLNLPITKTTLYTQQHLIEYDNRPCYLVKGDYVGKDTDGQPLINNISIIEKINSYRQDNPIKKVEQKFKVGDFIVHNNSGNTCQVTEIKDDKYCIWPLYAEIEGYLSFIDVDNDYHLWTIEDAKNGDVLCYKDDIFLLDYYVLFSKVGCHCCYNGRFIPHNIYSFTKADFDKIHPATKEQRDLLFLKMKYLGYKWNNKKKELEIKSKSSWSEEDENTFVSLCTKLPFMVNSCYLEDTTKYLFWLETLKQRLDGTK